MTGKLITIEGIDGSGKGTQSQLLIEKLQAAGKKVKMYSFPAYEQTFFGREVGAFLRGEFGSIDEVHPKLASVLFASDRLEQKPNLVADLEAGYYVVCDRYVESNMGHQAAKFAESERADFIDWLAELEYKVNGLPKPDITFFLDVPLEVSKELVLKKKQRSYTDEKEDIHEAAHGYLEKVYQVYQLLHAKNDWCRIPCVEQDNIRSIEAINNELLNKVEKL
ncbi:dTMP kinase [Planctobacterium marinum]|uniref:Thymidylate kinase n=1 Tax=Planctobacterium marinum TaxID=1631968 RepID=A0AA48HNV9_9ALTE|nr:thymidylate kinase [Planctobacterium marinum]